MSMNVNNAYTMSPFRPVMYVEGMENRMPQGFRLSIVRWKLSKDAKAKGQTEKRPTVAVMLPTIALSVTPDCLATAMKDAIEEMQDTAVRFHVANAIEAHSGINIQSIVIPESLGTPEGLASFAAAQAASGRLSKESLENWFDSMLQDLLLDTVLSKLPDGTANAAEVATKQVMKARDAIVSLASPRTAMPATVAIQLRKAISLVASADRTRQQLMDKLEMFINPPSTEELLLNI